jgi:hypothetical protein
MYSRRKKIKVFFSHHRGTEVVSTRISAASRLRSITVAKFAKVAKKRKGKGYYIILAHSGFLGIENNFYNNNL